MNKKEYFLSVFKAAEKKYGAKEKRLAGEGWKHDWQMLIATLYSAQTRDELTIPVMEATFDELDTLEKFASAPLSKIRSLTKKLNFYKTKSKNAQETARQLLKRYKGRVPDSIEELIALPGVGRKTANLVISEIHDKDGICVDTHVHRIANVFGFVKSKTPTETEFALKALVPQTYWSRINRIFVLWGKDVRGHDKQKFLARLKE